MSFTIGGDYIPKGHGPKKPSGPIKIKVQRRKNSFVTLILNLPLEKEELKELAKEMKQSLGCGGTLNETTIEIQGNKQSQTKAFLLEKGYKIS